MNKLRKFTTVGFVIFGTLIMISTIIALFNPTPSEDDGVPVPDTDNFKIEELTEEQIAKIPSCGYGFWSRKQTRGGKSGIGGSQYKYSDNDVDYCRHSMGKKTGITTFVATEAEDTILTLDIKSEIGGGIAKVVIVRDGKVIETFDYGESRTFTYTVEGESIFYVKGLFEKAEDVVIEVSRSFS